MLTQTKKLTSCHAKNHVTVTTICPGRCRLELTIECCISSIYDSGYGKAYRSYTVIAIFDANFRKRSSSIQRMDWVAIATHLESDVDLSVTWQSPLLSASDILKFSTFD